jgi:chromate transport protein ChrA
MYALLGERFAGWRGAFIALTVGALVPALIAVLLGAAYVVYAGHSLAQEVMQGAWAGAIAVFAWAIVRLLRPQLQWHRSRGLAVAALTLVLTLLLPIPQFVILVIAGGLGPAFLRNEP